MQPTLRRGTLVEARDAQRAREHEARVVVRAPELGVGDNAQEAVRYGCDGEQSRGVEGGEDPDEEFVGERGDDVGGGSWAFGGVGGGGGGEFAFRCHFGSVESVCLQDEPAGTPLLPCYIVGCGWKWKLWRLKEGKVKMSVAMNP